jgi:acetyltransferase-like isoleucine patch superfamily enzyme
MQDDRFENWKPPIIEERKLHPKYHFLIHHKDNLKLGKKTDIGAFTYINAKNGIEIQDNVQIGSHCSIYSFSSIDEKEGKIIIKNNARIGTHSTIMPGVTIGKNTVIGAYSLVTKDIPDNTLAYGIPAKIIGKNEK